ncbi:MAG: DNA-directed RNA polymerase subunit omega [Candidatus Caldatribacteriota bacterium]|nr:DNA-directed RNA polymerase subunit omega [Candidatus Caldatribacteriota bacterium]
MIDNRFLLAMMISKRVKQLKHGEKPLVKTKQGKLMNIALEEIKQGKVFIKKEAVSENVKTEEIFNESMMDE